MPRSTSDGHPRHGSVNDPATITMIKDSPQQQLNYVRGQQVSHHTLRKPASKIRTIDINSPPDSGASVSCRCTTSNVLKGVNLVRSRVSAQTSSSAIADIAANCSNFGHCVFEPPFRGLGTTYDFHLGFIGKRVVDLLLVLIEVFSLGVTAEALRAKTDPKSAILLQRGQFDPKFQVEWDVPHQSFWHG